MRELGRKRFAARHNSSPGRPMFLRNLPLSRKLLLAFSLVVLAAAATSGLIYVNLLTLEEAADSASRSETPAPRSRRWC